MEPTPGQRFRTALKEEHPLQVMGVMNAYCAMMAEKSGFRALYLSGAGVANFCHGLPDLALTTLNDVAEEAQRITSVVTLPLLVDIDTGWGNALMIEKSIRTLERVGVAAVHIEDQVNTKRCGHRPGKAVVETEEMVTRIRTCVQARKDPHFVIMARTDALAVEGLEAALRRAKAYEEAGADMLFAEGVTSLDEYRAFRSAISIPILANITEFGKTPLFTREQLASVGVDLILYPLTAARAMNKAALQVFETVRREGSQQKLIDSMQTREELYTMINYHSYEQQFDALQQEEAKK